MGSAIHASCPRRRKPSRRSLLLVCVQLPSVQAHELMSMQYLTASFALYAATMMILKVSLGLFYLRVSVATWQRWTVYITLAISTTFGTFYFFVAIFQCGNPADFLIHAIEGKCGNVKAVTPVNITATVINAVSSLVLVGLPIALIRQARLPMRVKLGGYAVVAIGSVGAIISLIRLKYISSLRYNSPNIFESGVDITIWSMLEVGICIAAASFATLRPLFRCCMEHTRSINGTGGSTPRRSSKFSPWSNRTLTDTSAIQSPRWPPRPSLQAERALSPTKEWHRLSAINADLEVDLRPTAGLPMPIKDGENKGLPGWIGLASPRGPRPHCISEDDAAPIPLRSHLVKYVDVHELDISESRVSPVRGS
jgi:hypothetical protein